MVRGIAWSWLCVCSSVLAADVAGPPASALLDEVKPPAGFDVSIFATSARANYPVFVAAKADGTLFVSSDGNSSLGRDPGRGRVLRLRDTDGDGTADEVREFVHRLDSPRGLVWVDDRLIVLHPPHITAFQDADDDGQADDQAGNRLVSGIAFDFSARTADHTSNGLALGVDGWIYAAIGDFGIMAAEGSDGRRLQLRGGGLVRFRPDGSGLDLFARGTRNTLEAAVGPLLDMIARDNTNDGGGWNVRLHAFTGLEDHGYPRRYMHFADEIVAPLADYGGGAGTGGCWIDEPWMPADLNDAAFTCDWGAGAIFRHPLTRRGAGYEAGQEPFITLTRATDLDVDAIGNIYAASWRGGMYRWSGPDVGFIARLRPVHAPVGRCPDFKVLRPEELLGVLAGPSHRLRLEAQRALLGRSLVLAASPALESLATDPAVRPASRVAAIFTLALGRKGEAVPVLQRLTADPAVAAWAVRALGDLSAEGIPVPLAVIARALESPDARTRKEAVVAAVRSGRGDAARLILPLAADADAIVAHTVVEGSVRLAAADEPAVIAACAAVLDRPASPAAVRRAAARVLGEIHSDASADTVIDRLARPADPASRPDLVWAAARLWRREPAWKGESWGTRPDTQGPYYALEEWTASPRLLAAVLATIAAADPAELTGLAGTLGLHRFPADVILPATRARGPSLIPVVTFFDRAGLAPPDASLSEIAAIAGPPAHRLAAIRVLASSTSPQSIRTLFDAVLAAEVAQLPADAIAQARQAATRSKAAAIDIREVKALASVSPGHRSLADDILLAVAGSSIAKSDVRGAAASWLAAEWNRDAARRHELVAASLRTRSRALANSLVAATDHADDATLAQAAADALKTLGIDREKVRAIAADSGPKIGQRDADEVIAIVDQQRGDRAVGAELFVSRKCIACHAAGADSTGLGPSLANAAGIYNRRQLAESVLLPNKSIAQGFATAALVLDDGRSLIGFVTSEGAESLALRDAQGVEHVVSQKSIEERTKLSTSVMPEGLVADLSVAQFASLLDYVESLAGDKAAP